LIAASACSIGNSPKSPSFRLNSSAKFRTLSRPAASTTIRFRSFVPCVHHGCRTYGAQLPNFYFPELPTMPACPFQAEAIPAPQLLQLDPRSSCRIIQAATVGGLCYIEPSRRCLLLAPNGLAGAFRGGPLLRVERK
jgi:hypothetical protein